MKMLTTKEISESWNISERMVRRFCVDGRIPEAKLENGTWMIPAGTAKPKRKPKEKTADPKENLTAFAKRVVYQRSKNNHYGIYEYIQVNLTYSSNRMASNRLTRNEVEEVYRTNKISTTFEPVKVDDIIETINHFAAVRYVVDNISAPLTQAFIKKLHHILTYGTYADRKENLRPGEFRLSRSKIGVPHKDIIPALSALLKEYEKGAVDIERILDVHVRFEQIRPFEDYNGRVGRLIMMKECLRHGIDPFIIDDKNRSLYQYGILAWSQDHVPMMSLVEIAQERFRAKAELCRLFKYAR
jgi:hypothetical protein